MKYTNKAKIDCSKVIVDAFISIYEDECVHALPQKLLDIFKFHIDNVKNKLEKNELGKFDNRIYTWCIEDGTEIFNKMQVLE